MASKHPPSAGKVDPAINADLVFDDVDRAVDRRTSRRTRPPRPDFPFSPAMERTVTERILGPRRHGL